jgi:hypothetical protein
VIFRLDFRFSFRKKIKIKNFKKNILRKYKIKLPKAKERSSAPLVGAARIGTADTRDGSEATATF